MKMLVVILLKIVFIIHPHQGTGFSEQSLSIVLV